MRNRELLYDFQEPPSPEDQEIRDNFFAELERNTAYYTDEEYNRVALELFGFARGIPRGGVSFFAEIARGDNFETLGYKNPRILVNKDYYEKKFGRDYSAMIPYDLEHERMEMYYKLKQGLNADVLDLKNQIRPQDLPSGTAHRLAIRAAFRKAHEEQRLGDYLAWYEVAMNHFQSLGGAVAQHAERELSWARQEAGRLTKTPTEMGQPDGPKNAE